MGKKFTFTEITYFDNCDGCPFREFVDDDYSPYHNQCTYLDRNKTINVYGAICIDDKDYRNEDGVLDDCPFLKQPQIKEENE